MMLLIGKPPQFDEHCRPVPGQCRPETDGWQLRIFDRGREEVLAQGTYAACRALQLACAGLSADEVRVRVRELCARASGDSVRRPGPARD